MCSRKISCTRWLPGQICSEKNKLWPCRNAVQFNIYCSIPSHSCKQHMYTNQRYRLKCRVEGSGEEVQNFVQYLTFPWQLFQFHLHWRVRYFRNRTHSHSKSTSLKRIMKIFFSALENVGSNTQVKHSRQQDWLLPRSWTRYHVCKPVR